MADTRFVGFSEVRLDDKGRMVLPAKIRAQLGPVAMLALGTGGCLALWTLDGFDEVMDRMWNLVKKGKFSQNHLRDFTAHAAEVTPDQQGRIVIPQPLRDRAGLSRDAVVIGARDRAEIWAADRWTDISRESTPGLADAMAELRI